MKRYKDTEYFITEDGKVFRNGKQMKTSFLKYEYKTAKLNGKRTSLYIHRMVAECYIENPENKREVNHIDGNRFNNTISNLEWVTHQENMLHARRILKSLVKENHNMVILDSEKVSWIRENYISGCKTFGMHGLAKKFGVSPSNIHKIIHKKTWI